MILQFDVELEISNSWLVKC